MRNRKGFTLIELLAVLVIMGIVIGISIPAVTAVNKRLMRERVTTFYKIVEEAADAYVEQYHADFEDTENCFDIPYKNLIKDELLKEDDITCLSEAYGEAEGIIQAKRVSDNTFEYSYYLTCYDKETNKMLDKSDVVPSGCLGVNGGYSLKVTTDYDGKCTDKSVTYDIDAENPYFFDLKDIQYQALDSFEWNNTGSKITDAFGKGTVTITADDGTYMDKSFKFRVIDVNNNVSSENGWFRVLIDKVKPDVEVEVKNKTTGNVVPSDTWTNDTLEYTFKRKENNVGLPGHKIEYCIGKNCTNFEEVNSTISIPNTGEYIVRYRITSCSGIVSDIHEYHAKVDKVVPRVNLSAKKKNANTEVESNKWSSEELVYRLSVAESGLSGYTIYYCVDDTKECDPSTEVNNNTLITNFNTKVGTYNFSYKIVSGAGSETKGNYIAKVDKVTPSVTLSAKKKDANTEVESNKWSSEELVYTLTETESGLSGYTIYYCVHDTRTCNPTTKVDNNAIITNFNTKIGTYNFSYKIVSGSGLESGGNYVAKVDKVTPSVTLSAKKKNANTEVRSNTWSSEELVYTLTETESGLSGYTIYYCVDDTRTCNPNTIVNNNTEINNYNTKIGTYNFSYKIVSGAGLNSGNNYKAKVDITGPVIDASNSTYTNGNPGNWSAKCSDEESGVVNENPSISINSTGPKTITCTNGAGINANRTHDFNSSWCATGSNTCVGGYVNGDWDNCLTGSNTCVGGYTYGAWGRCTLPKGESSSTFECEACKSDQAGEALYRCRPRTWNSCATGSNTCKGGYKQVWNDCVSGSNTCTFGYVW